MPAQLDMILPQERIDAMAASGAWPDRLLTDYLDETTAKDPGRIAITGHNSGRGQMETLSYRELQQLSTRFALCLAAHGIEKGDVVSYQLPNWWEFIALHLACLRIGAITNPVMPIFRHRELSFMLKFAETKIMIVPALFRGFDHEAMLEELRPGLPDLQHLFVIGGKGENSFERIFIDRRWEDEMDAATLFAERNMGPNDVNELLYTSGTTGQPKGAMHTANTQLSNILRYIEAVELGPDEIVLMSSPLAHQTGFLYGMMLSIVLGTKLILQDTWQADEAVRLIHDEGATFTMASTPFLADLVSAPTANKNTLSHFRKFVSGGAPIPRILVKEAMEKLGITVISIWGMTENGAVTITRPNDPPEKTFNTDGRAIPGMEVRVVDAQGNILPPNEEGMLQSRGACAFVGYMKKPELHGTDPDGWFDTGDLARMDEDGYIRITGRSKDILIRGGENIPVVEIEELLYRHPAIQDAALVGMPDPRLGERGCAFVTLRPGQALTLAEMVAYLAEEKMAKNYMPEHLEIIPDMPRTASGKIQKFKLREDAARMAEGNATDTAKRRA